MAHRVREPNLPDDIVGLASEVERRADVRKVGLDAVEPLSPAQPVARFVPLRELDAPGQLAAAHRVVGILAIELLRRIRTDRLEHAEAWIAPVAQRGGDQARVEKGIQGGRDVRSRLRDGFESLERRAARERGEHGQHLPCRGIEQANAPFHGGAQRALAFGEVGGGPGQKRQRLPEPLGGSLDPEDTDARCCQLDRQRKPVERPRYPGDRGDVRLGHRELGLGLARAVDVEANGGAGGDRVDVRLVCLGNCQRGNPVLTFHRETERDAAGSEDPKRRRGFEQLCDCGERIWKVLEVVDDDERLGTLGERVRQRLERR